MNVLQTKVKTDQQGATLITALMMLLVMTIIGISAIKMSSISILIAGNDQQKLMLMQETETTLNNLATPGKLIDPLINEPVNGVNARFDANTKEYQVPSPFKSNMTEIITDMDILYGCEGFDGKAVSIGSDVPPCHLYDFKVDAKKQSSGARVVRRRGAGKEVPNIAKHSFLTR
jgi:hypothetical protein